MEVLAAAVDQQTSAELQQGSGGSPSPGGGTAGAAAAKTRAAVQAEVQQEHAARVASEEDGSLVAWTEEVHEQVTAADAAFLTARDAHQKVGAPLALACRELLSLLLVCAPVSCYRRNSAFQSAMLPLPPPCAFSAASPLPPDMPFLPRRTLRALRRGKPTGQISAARATGQSGMPVWQKRSR